jgi:hypothetical protein
MKKNSTVMREANASYSVGETVKMNKDWGFKDLVGSKAVIVGINWRLDERVGWGALYTLCFTHKDTGGQYRITLTADQFQKMNTA